ncbi:MAG: alkaline phosphatase family protein [Methylobacter sp.]|nr:alkaline phosphatase family protein [Candidatus Methylobacter titanis]
MLKANFVAGWVIGGLIVGLTACVLPLISKPGVDHLKMVNHFVVIYQENHSFDNLYGGWERVNGLGNADTEHTIQISQDGTALRCLPQNDPNLRSPPLPVTCKDSWHGITSAFDNRPFRIDTYIPATANTCKNGASGGCTADMVHKFYQSQYQINGGRMNRFVAGSDAAGMPMGYYDTKHLPIYRYLHSLNHPHYAILDNFFQAAFGGSFINHQWLIAAKTPIFEGAGQNAQDDFHSQVDSNGMPTGYPFYTPKGDVKDAELTASCSDANIKILGLACGDFVINAIQPWYQPHAPDIHNRRLPPLKMTNIGAALSAANIDWAWYGGGWSNADGDAGEPGWTNGNGTRCSDPNANPQANYPHCPDKLFQFHHQPFNYYAAFDPASETGRANRKAHLKDEAEFTALAKASKTVCRLKAVSFVKPIGAENEHPGYASEYQGNDHLVELIRNIENSVCANDTMIIVTYDEFGGQWDHVSPPDWENDIGPHDQWGPGTRIPALVLAPFLQTEFAVDHTPYDTTSILATIERRYGLNPLGSRDAIINDLSNIFEAR